MVTDEVDKSTEQSWNPPKQIEVKFEWVSFKNKYVYTM